MVYYGRRLTGKHYKKLASMRRKRKKVGMFGGVKITPKVP